MAKEVEIITIFKALTAVHEKFNEKAIKKEEAVKKNDIPTLNELLKEESALIQQLRKLENTRQHVVHAWMQEKGFVKEDVTFEQLLKFFPEEHKEELQQWKERLVSEITKLKDQNELNQQLIEDSLRFVNMSLDAMQPQQEFSNYQKPTSSRRGMDEDIGFGNRSLFDSKV